MGENYIFKGKWIGADMAIEDRRAPIFKKTFTITKEIKKAEMLICGLGLFELKSTGSSLMILFLTPLILNIIKLCFTEALMLQIC